MTDERTDSTAAAFTGVLDRHSGAVRARGHLTVQGADLLLGAVHVLRDGGHRRVVLDLTDVPDADDEGLSALRSLQESVGAEGGELVLVPGPRAPA